MALADGTVFEGVAIGAVGRAVGEVVFNTAMTGYQEILTDPSYHSQLVTLTYPHIGNVGVNAQDAEAAGVQVSGLIIRDLPRTLSSWRATEPLDSYLARHGVVALAGIDTRALTRRLRDGGAQSGCLAAGPDLDADACLAAARAFAGLAGADLACAVSLDAPSPWQDGALDWLGAGSAFKAAAGGPHVVAYDFGIKRNILRNLVDRGCRVTLIPADTPAEDALALRPDGIFLSNGPGDPQPCDYAQEAIRELVATGLPTFGICLGHQLLCLALGASSVKMKFGHHGANHPIKDHVTGRVFISSQNHGFAIDAASLPDFLQVTHTSLFDGSLQGVSHKRLPVYSFQGHPEASPGPRELESLFDRFMSDMSAASTRADSEAPHA